MTTISIKAKHLANGVPGDCEHCPVALAILDAIPGPIDVMVGPDEISISRGDLWIPFRVPQEVVAFIRAFDDGGNEAVDPFTFELDYPAVTA